MENELPPMHHVGLRRHPFTDAYQFLVSLGWPALVAWIALAFFLVNGVFTALYMIGGDCYAAEHPSSVLEAFSFSVQTMSSTGYGVMHPTTAWAHSLTILESFMGLMGTALATGLVFAKFARPTARMGFSNRAIVIDFDGKPTLQFRLANQRHTQVVNAQVQVNALLRRTTAEGQSIRLMYSMPLVRHQTPAFRLSWTVIHELDEHSPIGALADRKMPEDLIAILVTVVGLDEGFSQTVHAQAIYRPPQILFDHHFEDMLTGTIEEGLTIDHQRLHDVKPIG